MSKKSLVFVLAVAWTASVLAQQTGAAQQVSAAAAVAATQAHDMSVREIFEKGGSLMYPIALLSVLALAFVIYFIFTLRREQLIPARFVTGLQGLLREGKLTEARAACHASPSAIAAIMEAAIDYALRTQKPDPGLLREIVEGEGSRQATQMQNQTQYLQDIGVLAPMLGLLGTVWGMLKAFNVVALDMARARPLELAGGISLALITTVGGLVVAIPSMGAYVFFRNRAAKLMAELEVASAKLLLEIEKRS